MDWGVYFPKANTNLVLHISEVHSDTVDTSENESPRDYFKLAGVAQEYDKSAAQKSPAFESDEIYHSEEEAADLEDYPDMTELNKASQLYQETIQKTVVHTNKERPYYGNDIGVFSNSRPKPESLVPHCHEKNVFIQIDSNVQRPNSESKLQMFIQVDGHPKEYIASRVIVDVVPNQECPICYDTFILNQVTSRLDCFCLYHQDCIELWWKKKSTRTCPFHAFQ